REFGGGMKGLAARPHGEGRFDHALQVLAGCTSSGLNGQALQDGAQIASDCRWVDRGIEVSLMGCPFHPFDQYFLHRTSTLEDFGANRLRLRTARGGGDDAQAATWLV